MSRFSFWLAGWACVGMLIGPAVQMRAQEAPADAANGKDTI